MRWNGVTAGRGLATALAIVFAVAPHAGAQASEEAAKPEVRPMPPPQTVQTVFLTNASEQNDLNDIQTDLRNALPSARIYGVQTQSAITIRATAEDMETAKKIIAELDRPKKLYRLTFTITDLDGGKKAGSQQFVLIAVAGQKSTFKQGSRVPIVTAKDDGPGLVSSIGQVQYLDEELNIEATVSGSPDELTLHAKVEQTSVADDKTTTAAPHPTIRHTTLDEISEPALAKPLVLGSLDVPGTTRRQEITVVAEIVR